MRSLRLPTLSLLFALGSVTAPGSAATAPEATGLLCIAPFGEPAPVTPTKTDDAMILSTTTWGPSPQSRFSFRVGDRTPLEIGRGERACIAGLPADEKMRVEVKLDEKPFETFFLRLADNPEGRICLRLRSGFWHWVDLGWDEKIGCGPTQVSGSSLAPSVGVAAPPTVLPPFVDRVWKVAESNSVDPGQLYVFLSEGTAVFASPYGTPAFGRWTFEGGVFTIFEEGRPHRTEIVSASPSELRLRMRDPGDGVDLRLVPAAASSSGGGSSSSIGSLAGSSWKLAAIGETAAVPGVEATLLFSSDGKVSGAGSCNRFMGSVEIGDGSLAFGPLASTRRACVAADANRQEARYLAALQAATRFRRDGEALLLNGPEKASELRFVPLL